VDVAVFAWTGEAVRLALIRREHEPFAGSWALPGGFLELEETIEIGARRELREETGLEISCPLHFVGVYGDPGRDPRGRTISIVYRAALGSPLPEIVAADDAAEASWIDPFTVKSLAFDHKLIVRDALNAFRDDVVNGTAGQTLLPEPFDQTDVGRLFHALRVSSATPAQWFRRHKLPSNPTEGTRPN
jgi:8-oxo-dGTP diphosphatase